MARVFICPSNGITIPKILNNKTFQVLTPIKNVPNARKKFLLKKTVGLWEQN